MKNRQAKTNFAAGLGLLMLGTAIVLPVRTFAQSMTAPSSSPMTMPTRSPSPAPNLTPTSTGQSTVRISDLPNGVYRYWNGQPSSPGGRVTDEEMFQRGGVTFLFRKMGNQVEGSFGYVDGEAACVRGTVNGNTISGRAFSDNGSIASRGETFANWGPASFLQVRRGVRAGIQTRYSSAILNLNGLNRINAGDQAPLPCPR